MVFHLGFRHAGAATLRMQGPELHENADVPWVIPVPARAALAAAPGAPYLLTVALEPAALTATASLHDAGSLHYFRLADGTVQPLEAAPGPLTFQAGDAYIAVTAGAARLAAAEPGGPSAAIARFLHLRDYFNAHKLAAALLDHLLELSLSQPPDGAGVLVIELR
jgi:hypothetical protein